MPIVTAEPALPTPEMAQTLRLKNNQPSINEAPALVPVEETPKPIAEDLLSPKYAELARQSRVLRRRLQDARVKEDALKAKEAEYASQYIPKTQIAERFRTDPYAALKDFGLTGDELTQALINQPSPQDQMIRELKAELAALKTSQDQVKTSIDEQATRSYDQAIHQITEDVKSLVKSSEDFSIIAETKSEKEVVDLITHVFEKGWPEKQIVKGTILSIEEAAKEVESFLIDDYVQKAKLSKIQKRLLPETSEAPPADPLPSTKAPSAAKTLSHTQMPSSTKPMTPRERAIAAFEGRLK